MSETQEPLMIETQGPSEEEEEDSPATFESIGLIPPLLKALESLNYAKPTSIQAEAIPFALQGRDIIGVAETGSGKTAAFVLPILQRLWDDPKPFFACCLAPTRELAEQIASQFNALGSDIGVRCVVIIGGASQMDQAIALAKRPHIIVATPGRLQDHLDTTKGFSLRNLKYLVLDEADRLLDLDFGPAIEKILKQMPKERNTYLFSATMTTKVAKLQRASLRNPVRLQVASASKYATVSTLVEHYLFLPLVYKDAYLVYVLNETTQYSTIVFTRTVHESQRVALLLRTLGFGAIPINGQLSQIARLGALEKFKSGGRNILVATDIAARGLDIPGVDMVINYDIPQQSVDYVHRVGRTARAGKRGKSISFVTQYDVETMKRIEAVTGKDMLLYSVPRDGVMLLRERVGEAQRTTVRELKELAESGPGKGSKKRKVESKRDAMDRDDDSHEAGMPSATKKSRGKK